jgi:type IV fimbrial biogenesis protein FimT
MPWTRCRVSRGFTLIELLVTLAVAAVILALAAPSFSNLVAQNRITTQTNVLIGGLNLAKSEAVRRGYAVALRSLSNDNLFDGWQVFSNQAADGIIPATVTAANGTVITQSQAMGVARITRGTLNGDNFTANAGTGSGVEYVLLNARGGVAQAPVVFKVCSAANPKVVGRLIQITAVGQISLVSTDAKCTPS